MIIVQKILSQTIINKKKFSQIRIRALKRESAGFLKNSSWCYCIWCYQYDFGSSFFIIIILFYLFIYLFIFFEHKKSTKMQNKQFHPLKKFCAPKKLLLLLFFVRLILLVGFGLICIFYAQNLFVKKQKKKINRHEIVLITSNAILLMLIPIGHVTLDVWWS